MQTFDEILNELKTCDPKYRGPKIAALMGRIDDPTPQKTLSQSEKDVIEDIRSEIRELSSDPYENEHRITALVRSIHRIEGRQQQ
jgi:hypothetical protein